MYTVLVIEINEKQTSNSCLNIILTLLYIIIGTLCIIAYSIVTSVNVLELIYVTACMSYEAPWKLYSKQTCFQNLDLYFYGDILSISLYFCYMVHEFYILLYNFQFLECISIGKFISTFTKTICLF